MKGAFGFFIWPGGQGDLSENNQLIVETKYDNVFVRDIADNQELNILKLHQYSPPWNLNIYDNADDWAEIPTVERWGCALTSAAMVLRYYNHNVWPDTYNGVPKGLGLNTWLNKQQDGYIRNGLINWLAISRLTNSSETEKIYIENPLQALEYRRIKNPSNSNIDSELTEKHPPIIEFPRHFIVVKGKTDNDYTINDPGSGMYNLLTDVIKNYGLYNSLSIYIPSNTNLSYLMFVIDGDVDISVRKDGTNIGNAFVDFPLFDDINMSLSNLETLKTFLYAKPEEGEYKIKVIGGDGPFQLQVYRYNTEGNLIRNNILNFYGNTKSENPYMFSVFYGDGTEIKMLLELLKSFWRNDKISDGVYFALRNKLLNADVIRNYSKKISNNILNAFINQLNAQKGKGIAIEAFNVLFKESNSLLSPS